jgi:hypothetical protein
MLTLIVMALVIAFCVWFGLSLAGRTQRFSYEGQTYYRKKDGSFLDANKNPIRDAAMIGLLTAGFTAYVANLGTGQDYSGSDSNWSSDSADSGGGDGGGGGGD